MKKILTTFLALLLLASPVSVQQSFATTDETIFHDFIAFPEKGEWVRSDDIPFLCSNWRKVISVVYRTNQGWPHQRAVRYVNHANRETMCGPVRGLWVRPIAHAVRGDPDEVPIGILKYEIHGRNGLYYGENTPGC